MPDHTHDPRTPAGRAALRALLALVEPHTDDPRTPTSITRDLLDLADERDALAALLREAREAVARGPRAPVELVARIDAALAEEPRP